MTKFFRKVFGAKSERRLLGQRRELAVLLIAAAGCFERAE